ncbi:MAG TPA: peptidylprolyl isomerase [Candidatus Sulfotelmatobacter sp.]|nr:peptidylprolyl isomerase [Candidatus Sulfotelmatobacter sp.]
MSWLLCVSLGALAWGQAAQTAPPPQPAPAPAATSASVPDDAAVLTITGVCDSKPQPANTSDCKTVITKGQFEKLVHALAPGANLQQKKQLAGVLPRVMAMSKQAKERGMDQTEQYMTTLEFVKMQVLSQQLQRKLQEEAADISDADIEKYYRDNPDAFEQYNVDRIFVPRTKQGESEAEDDEKDDKVTAQQKKTKENTDQAKKQENEQVMTKLAESLRARAAAGEDIAKLQKEAFEKAGMKIESPTVNLPSVRRNGLPQAHTVVFDLKPGEVSQVISDAGGHYIYKMNSKTMMTLDQAKGEIRGRLENDRMRENTEKLNASFSSVLNEAYFGPGGVGPTPPPRMPLPRPGAGPKPAPGAAPGNAGPPAQSNGQTPAPQKD